MKNTKAYLAGIVDGEGYMGLSRYKRSDRLKNGVLQIRHTPRLIISFLNKKVNKKVLDLFVKNYGGLIRNKKVYEYNSGAERKSHNAMIVYEVSGSRVLKILTELLPFLIIKKTQAKLLLKFKTVTYCKKGGIKKKDFIFRENLWANIKLLNGNK